MRYRGLAGGAGRAVALVSLVAILTACSGGSGEAVRTSDSDAQPEVSEATPDTSADPGTEAPPGPASAGDGVANGLEPAPPVPPRETLPPVPLDEPAVVEGQLKVLLVSFRDVETPAGVPGEIGGPGVAFDLTVINAGDGPLDLSNVVADLRTGRDLNPVLAAYREPTRAFAGALAPGERTTATYAFTIAESERDDVTLFLSLNASTPTITFQGSAR